MNGHLLSLVLFTPLAGLLVLLFIPSRQKELIKVWANLASFAGFLISLPLVSRFDKGVSGFQFVGRANWIPSLGAQYLIGIDGISLLLIMLTTVIGFIAILSSWNAVQDRLKEYYCMFLLLQVGMLGVFMSLDFFLFYVFWRSASPPSSLRGTPSRTGSKNTTACFCCCKWACWAYSCPSISSCFTCSGNWCWCPCTSSSPCGAARASYMRPSSFSFTRWPARC